jgi:chemotaxis protein histidine kinase CheA
MDSYEGGQNGSESSISSEIESPKEEPVVPAQKLDMSSDSSEKSISSEEEAKSDEKSIPSEEEAKSLESIPSEKSISSEESAETVKPVEESKSSENSVQDVKPLEESIPSEKLAEEAKSDYAEESIASEKVKEAKEEGEEEEKEAKSDSESEEEEEDVVRNIDGMKLNKPYYFQTLIEKKDPILILKEDTPQFNSYPRTCSSNMRRQPVILTDSQLAKINKDHPKFLRPEDVIKYGSDEKHQFNYICPRFWCLKTNTFVDPNDLTEVIGEDGTKELVHPTCGKVLPKGEKQVKPGYYVYEFYTPKPGKKDYKKYPGLIPDSHPNGLCVPCCFEKYNTEGRIKENSKCLDKKTKEPAPKNVANKAEDEYIKGPDKFPQRSSPLIKLGSTMRRALPHSDREKPSKS